MSDTRLIERWLPIAALGEESIRERRALSALPAPYYLHVWWARRPLVAARAAVLASLLPAETSHAEFMNFIGIKGDPVNARKKIDSVKRTGIRVDDPYGYDRAFSSHPPKEEIHSKIGKQGIEVLDPTAGGGSIPFEAARLGFTSHGNDLNPVSSLILKATVEYPNRFGRDLRDKYDQTAAEFVKRCKFNLKELFPKSTPDEIDTTYIWARSTICPYCSGQVPIAPNWKITPTGIGIKLQPHLAGGPGANGRICAFEVVDTANEHSQGTVAGKELSCPYSDCSRIFSLESVKADNAAHLQAALCAVVYRKRVTSQTKSGKQKFSWERKYRSPRSDDIDIDAVEKFISSNSEEWEAQDCLPTEILPSETESWTHGNTLHQYGATRFTDLFSRRQIAVHGTSVQVFREMLSEKQSFAPLSDIDKAVFVYIALTIDKLIDWNSTQCTWDLDKLRMAHTFQVHAFPIRWSFAEMNVVADDLGYDWVVKQTSRCLKELVDLVHGKQEGKLFPSSLTAGDAAVTHKSGDNLDHLSDKSIDAIVMDPPYGANVMYAELADFFYVWLKRTAGLILPQMFSRHLSDKELEAVANKGKYKGQKGSDGLAVANYRERMTSIFQECQRVLKQDGIMTVMFTHKELGAWDALTKSLIEAGFTITASWPINTEAESSTHIKSKAAANSTIFLVCRQRFVQIRPEVKYWEDIEPLVAKAVRDRVPQFQQNGIGGVDLYLASFGPALEEFSKHWPMQRGTPKTQPNLRKRQKKSDAGSELFDPYTVTPEDALEAARREVKTWRLNQLMQMRGNEDLDPATSWFVLAWDAFKAPAFAYDEGLRLARAVGVDLESLVGRLCEKKGSDLKLWDSATRAVKGALGPVDGSGGMIDVIHHAAHLGRTKAVENAVELLSRNRLDTDTRFLNALEAVLEVLPPSKGFLGFDVATGDAKASADDFDVLERLRRVAFADAVDQPKQLELFAQEAAQAEAAE